MTHCQKISIYIWQKMWLNIAGIVLYWRYGYYYFVNCFNFKTEKWILEQADNCSKPIFFVSNVLFESSVFQSLFLLDKQACWTCLYVLYQHFIANPGRQHNFFMFIYVCLLLFYFILYYLDFPSLAIFSPLISVLRGVLWHTFSNRWAVS